MITSFDKFISLTSGVIDAHRKPIQKCRMSQGTYVDLECDYIENGGGTPDLIRKSIYGVPVEIDQMIPPSEIHFVIDGEVKERATL